MPVSQLDHDGLVGREAPHQPGELAVEEQHSAVDDHHPPAQSLDVGHVVAGEEHGGAVAPVVFGQEGANPALHGDVEADGRLVEKEDLGFVQEGGGDFAFHALAQVRGCAPACRAGPSRSSSSVSSSTVCR